MFILGVDLGQAVDYTAISIVEQINQRQMGPVGRELVTIASDLVPPRMSEER